MPSSVPGKLTLSILATVTLVDFTLTINGLVTILPPNMPIMSTVPSTSPGFWLTKLLTAPPSVTMLFVKFVVPTISVWYNVLADESTRAVVPSVSSTVNRRYSRS